MTYPKASPSALYTDTPDTPTRLILRDTGNPDTPETQDTPDSLDLAGVFTVEKAIALSGPTHPQPLFRFSRCLRKVEMDRSRKFSNAELERIFSQWWNQYAPAGQKQFHWLADFQNIFKRTKVPLGENAFTDAMRKADSNTEIFGTYPEDIQRLLRICAVLQKSAGDGAFFLSVRQTATVLDIESLYTANAILAKLVNDGVLRLTKKGTRHKASEYRMPKPTSAVSEV